MNKNIVIAVVLGVLLALSVVQAFQVNAIKEKISSGGVSLGGGGAIPAASGGGLPAGLDNLPTMVGGC